MSVKRLRYLAAVTVVLALAACGSETPATEPSPSVSPVVESAAPSPSGEPSPSGGAPSMDDVIQAEAATVAQEYLDFMGFSRDRLITQLADFEGFPLDLATAAVDSLGADWDEQAVRTAEMYLDEEALTHAEFVAQLTSTYDQYTPLQAEHAADAVG
jgi:hypothetical protein